MHAMQQVPKNHPVSSRVVFGREYPSNISEVAIVPKQKSFLAKIVKINVFHIKEESINSIRFRSCTFPAHFLLNSTNGWENAFFVL